MQLKINLKKAEQKDFKKLDASGRGVYLYGKLYFVRYGEDMWAAHVFRNTKRSRANFNYFFTADMVWVPDSKNIMNE